MIGDILFDSITNLTPEIFFLDYLDAERQRMLDPLMTIGTGDNGVSRICLTDLAAHAMKIDFARRTGKLGQR